MAELTYTSEARGFTYTDGEYRVTGSRKSAGNAVTEIDGASVHRSGTYIGNFYVRFSGGTPRVTISNAEIGNIDVLRELVSDLLAEMGYEG